MDELKSRKLDNAIARLIEDNSAPWEEQRKKLAEKFDVSEDEVQRRLDEMRLSN